MQLSHFSNAETITPRSVSQENQSHFKPRGFWVSVDGEDDWPTFCRESEWTPPGTNRFRVTLAEGPLVLDSVDAVRAFDARFGVSYLDRVGGDDGHAHVDWLRVAARWPGIIIAPYQWALRMDDIVEWYYPWDCASGCIWDASVITSVERVAAEAVAR